MKKLYYNENEGQFYLVTKRPKTILIEWVEYKTPQTYDSNGEVIEWFYHDITVNWDNDFVEGKGMVVSTCGKNKCHCLRKYEDDYILIYPYQAGLPFELRLATKRDIQKEICRDDVSKKKYYERLCNLLKNS